MSHTPGPWKVWISHLNTFLVVTDDHREAIICDFDRLNRTNNADNSRLIAAAPELLEAVKFCASVIEANGVFEESERMALKKAKAAVAKAEDAVLSVSVETVETAREG